MDVTRMRRSELAFKREERITGLRKERERRDETKGMRDRDLKRCLPIETTTLTHIYTLVPDLFREVPTRHLIDRFNANERTKKKSPQEFSCPFFF